MTRSVLISRRCGLGAKPPNAGPFRAAAQSLGLPLMVVDVTADEAQANRALLFKAPREAVGLFILVVEPETLVQRTWGSLRAVGVPRFDR